MQKKIINILIITFVIFSINFGNLFGYSTFNFTFKGNYQRTGYVDSNIRGNAYKVWTNQNIKDAKEIIYINDRLIVLTKDNRIVSLNEKTLNIDWSFKTYSEITSKLTFNDNMLFFGTYEGKIFCIDWFTGIEKWSYPVFGSIFTSPLIIGNSVIFGSLNGKLYSFDKKNGAKIWEYNSGCSIESSPAYNGSYIVLCNAKGFVYYLNSNGYLKWMYNAKNPIITTPIILDDKIIVSTYEGNLLCLNFSGKLQWNKKITPYSIHSPVSYDGKIYMVCSDGLLYAYNTTNGALLWFSAIGKGLSTPIITNNFIIYLAGEKWLNLIDRQNGKKVVQYEELIDNIIDVTVSPRSLFYLTKTSKICAYETF
jgi:outer membrane protein assembly factor BamB